MKSVTKNEYPTIVEQSEELKAYWKEIRRIPVMTATREREIFMQLKAGTGNRKRLIDELVLSNQRLIYTEAVNFTSNPAKIMDLIIVGSITVQELIESGSYDYTHNSGASFATYVRNYIHRDMFESFNKEKAIIRRSNELKIGWRISGIKEKFFKENQRDPSTAEIKEILKDKYDIEVGDERDICDVNISYIDGPANNESDDTLCEAGDFAMDTASVNDFEVESEREYKMQKLNQALGCLDEREREIVKLIYGIGYGGPVDADDIAERFNITRTRVQQIRRTAEAKMRDFAMTQEF